MGGEVVLCLWRCSVASNTLCLPCRQPLCSGGIEKFLPYSFDLVNKTAKVFLKKERRFVYTTPKSYLELLKLYKDLLARKRDEMGRSIDRLTNGLAKLRSTAEAVVEIEADLKIKLEDAEQKKTTAEGIATEVRRCAVLLCGGGVL